MLTEALLLAAVLLGAFFMLVASLGVLRLSDFFLRMHAPTKAATLGLFLLLIALIISTRDGKVATKALLAVLFIGATAPVGAHILSRAAIRSGLRPPDAPPDLGSDTSPPPGE